VALRWRVCTSARLFRTASSCPCASGCEVTAAHATQHSPVSQHVSAHTPALPWTVRHTDDIHPNAYSILDGRNPTDKMARHRLTREFQPAIILTVTPAITSPPVYAYLPDYSLSFCSPFRSRNAVSRYNGHYLNAFRSRSISSTAPVLLCLTLSLLSLS
jgi:hypothetical protein